MIKTFEELMEIDNLVGLLYREDPALPKTKFGYAYKKFYKDNIKDTFEEYRDNLADARLELALEDEKTHEVITDETSPRGFKFNKDSLIQLILKERKIKEEFFKKEIKIIPYFSTFIPPTLDIDEIAELQGLIIPDDFIQPSTKNTESKS